MRFTINFKNQEAQASDETVNPVKIAKKVLSLLEYIERPVNIKKISTELEIALQPLQRALSQLLLDEQIHQTRKDTYALTETYKTLEGQINAKREGHGILKTKSGQEISISPRQMDMVWDGDHVLVSLGSRVFYGKPEGIIEEVLERAHTRVTGQFGCTSEGVGFIKPDNPKLPDKILIPDFKKSKAKPNDHIAVEITQYPSKQAPALGKVVENLGQGNTPFVQTELSILRHNLPNTWPPEVTKQAKAHKLPREDDLQGRVDLRELPLMTIDGESARDFDDAVFACRKPRGGWRLWVAIADVSHYVPKGSPLDLEAVERGTSVYFPHRVIPMLPEELSNELCSLKPNVDRLAMVCEMAISASGKVSKFVFYEAVIRSHARLTYNQVAAFLAGTEYENKASNTISQGYPALCEPILDLYTLYQALFETRHNRGALEFGTTETEFRFDQEGHIRDVVPVFRNDAHKLIEEMMLAANVCAAKLLLKHETPAMYRNHEPPSTDRVKSLESALQAFGAKPKFGNDPSPGDFLQFLEKVAERPDGHILQTLLLRSMSQARYEADCKGHFGLAYQAYTHFTSPIRRYPDLVVHRAIRYLIRNQKGNHLHREKGAKKVKKSDWLFDKPSVLAEIAQKNSECERRADDATRDVVAWLKCAYMQDQLGATFTGQISGVTHFGLFVTIDELMIDGLVHISNLDQDYYTFNDQTMQLIGERSGFVYKIGDPLVIKVARVSLDDRKIDFVPLHTKKRAAKGQKKTSRRKR